MGALETKDVCEKFKKTMSFWWFQGKDVGGYKKSTHAKMKVLKTHRKNQLAILVWKDGEKKKSEKAP